MEKLQLVREFAELAARESLPDYLVRLYLFLLAASGEDGRGSIHPAAAARALGENWTPADLRRGARALAQQNLIEIVSLPGAAGTRGLDYRLRPPGREET